MLIIGIDVGKNGAMVVMNSKGSLLYKTLFPKIKNEYDLNEFANIVRYIKSKAKNGIICYIEKIHAIQGSAAGATFSFGESFMMPKAIMAALEIPYVLVPPQTWQEVIFDGITKIRKQSTGKTKSGKPKLGRVDTKAMALIAFKQLYPKLNGLATERSKEPHDGIVDATHIAEYGRRKNY